MLDAFRSADQVLLSGVQGITDLITTPGLINLDFADVKSVMQGAGSALMGIGSARGEDRAIQAAETAISSPLLEASVDGAHGVLLSIQGGSDLGLFEINEAARLVQEAAHPEANIIFGAVIDDALGDEVRVTVIAAGFDGGAPTRRRDERALGQVSGRSVAASPAPVAAASRPAPPPAPRPQPLDAGPFGDPRPHQVAPVGSAEPVRRGIGEYRHAEPAPSNGSSYPSAALPPVTPPVTGAPLGSPAPAPGASSASAPAPQQAQPAQAPGGDREPAVVPGVRAAVRGAAARAPALPAGATADRRGRRPRRPRLPQVASLARGAADRPAGRPRSRGPGGIHHAGRRRVRRASCRSRPRHARG